MRINYRECKTEYSQNRLRRRILRKLLARSSIVEGDLVYDIGAGDGVISEELTRRGARVIAIEKDSRLIAKLRRKLGTSPLMTIRHGDFLAETLPSLARYKVFANIPFILTADIVRKLLFSQNPPDDCYLVMQKEAAKKFAGTSRETLFSLLLKPWFEFRALHSFRKTDFFPVPTVDIVLLQIEKRERALVTSEQAHLYRNLLVYGFRQGKPTIKSAFKGVFTHTQFRKLSQALGLPHNAVPTGLSFRQWLGLFDFFLGAVDKHRQKPIRGAERRLREQQSCREKIRQTHRRRNQNTPMCRSKHPFKSSIPML